MHVMSAKQQAAWTNGEVPPTELVTDDIMMVALPMPGEGMPSSFGYAYLGTDTVQIIDPGWNDERNIDGWESALKAHGRTVRDISTIVVTHAHPDHIGLAEPLRSLTGAEIVMSATESRIMHGEVRTQLREQEVIAERLERWGVPDDVREQQLRDLDVKQPPAPVQADRLLEPGETLTLAGREIHTFETPGHTTGHLCLVDESVRVIFTGDHVLPGISPGLGLGSTPGSDPLTDYLGSLEMMAAYDNCQVLPGHEYRFTGLAERSRQIASHHLRRTRAIAELEPKLGDVPVWEYASRAPWSRGWGRMSGFLLHSALTQTELHLEAVRSGRVNRWLDGPWPTHA